MIAMPPNNIARAILATAFMICVVSGQYTVKMEVNVVDKNYNGNNLGLLLPPEFGPMLHEMAAASNDAKSKVTQPNDQQLPPANPGGATNPETRAAVAVVDAPQQLFNELPKSQIARLKSAHVMGARLNSPRTIQQKALQADSSSVEASTQATTQRQEPQTKTPAAERKPLNVNKIQQPVDAPVDVATGSLPSQRHLQAVSSSLDASTKPTIEPQYLQTTTRIQVVEGKPVSEHEPSVDVPVELAADPVSNQHESIVHTDSSSTEASSQPTTQPQHNQAVEGILLSQHNQEYPAEVPVEMTGEYLSNQYHSALQADSSSVEATTKPTAQPQPLETKTHPVDEKPLIEERFVEAQVEITGDSLLKQHDSALQAEPSPVETSTKSQDQPAEEILLSEPKEEPTVNAPVDMAEESLSKQHHSALKNLLLKHRVQKATSSGTANQTQWIAQLPKPHKRRPIGHRFNWRKIDEAPELRPLTETEIQQSVQENQPELNTEVDIPTASESHVGESAAKTAEADMLNHANFNPNDPEIHPIDSAAQGIGSENALENVQAVNDAHQKEDPEVERRPMVEPESAKETPYDPADHVFHEREASHVNNQVDHSHELDTETNLAVDEEEHQAHNEDVPFTFDELKDLEHAWKSPVQKTGEMVNKYQPQQNAEQDPLLINHVAKKDPLAGSYSLFGDESNLKQTDQHLAGVEKEELTTESSTQPSSTTATTEASTTTSTQQTKRNIPNRKKVSRFSVLEVNEPVVVNVRTTREPELKTTQNPSPVKSDFNQVTRLQNPQSRSNQEVEAIQPSEPNAAKPESAESAKPSRSMSGKSQMSEISQHNQVSDHINRTPNAKESEPDRYQQLVGSENFEKPASDGPIEVDGGEEKQQPAEPFANDDSGADSARQMISDLKKSKSGKISKLRQHLKSLLAKKAF